MRVDHDRTRMYLAANELQTVQTHRNKYEKKSISKLLTALPKGRVYGELM